ncbi:derlin TDEL_0B03110 [Torulaspora delbrueckii]|uniref:Derlin n=1 Tax=Torulaspora delbrueckii TaxID=4950 RepID=G8ZP96_TORDE|nr:hypothetical protein TDEL_0B03110 [Torulaspora delbrueckii]CCE90440.1 hypothetical protein TDEL_0B03110 [Torulaspora delbrueckii]
MDAVLLNIVGSVPLVTKLWAIGCVGLSLLTSTYAVDPSKKIYNFDLVFKKGQYGRILYSLFDYGELDWALMFNIYMSINHLTVLENSFNSKRRYCWIVILTLACIIVMSSMEQPASSLGVILHENLVYYQVRRNIEGEHFRMLGFEVSPLMIPLYMNAFMLFVLKRSWLQVAMNFVPGHILCYLDDTINKIYGVDLCKTPYDWWIDRRARPIR